MSMSKREAIEKMGCEKKGCSHLNPDGVYSFCDALFTDEFCSKRDKKDREEFYSLAEKYGFIRV